MRNSFYQLNGFVYSYLCISLLGGPNPLFNFTPPGAEASMTGRLLTMNFQLVCFKSCAKSRNCKNK